MPAGVHATEGASRASPLTLALMLAVAACGEDATWRYESDELVVISGEDTPVCRGTILSMEAVVQDVRDRFGISSAAARVSIGRDHVDAHCTWGGGGCAWGTGDDAEAVAVVEYVHHELVHVVRRQADLAGPPAVEEGIAEYFEREREARDLSFFVRDYPLSVSELLRENREGLVATGGVRAMVHFLAFLVERYGSTAVWEFLGSEALTDRSPEGFADAFALAFGASLSDVDEAWTTTAPIEFDFGSVCTASNTVEFAGGSLRISGVHDCREASSSGPYLLMGEAPVVREPWRCVVFTTQADVDVSLAGAGDSRAQFEIEACGVGLGGGATSISLSTGETERVSVPACTFRLLVSGDYAEAIDEAPVEYELGIRTGQTHLIAARCEDFHEEVVVPAGLEAPVLYADLGPLHAA